MDDKWESFLMVSKLEMANKRPLERPGEPKKTDKRGKEKNGHGYKEPY
jgi:hypothetical protein